MNGVGIPIVALDVDGTLGDYHGHFLAFAEGWFDQEMPSTKDINNGRPLWEFMGVDHHKYVECKLAYRQGGQKRTMPVFPGASDLTRQIRLAGAQVWICTTRPYMRLDNIDPDTREWLRRHRIEYDAVLFDTLEGKGTKYDELARQAGRRVCAIMEDLPELVFRVAALPELPTPILRDQPYNQHVWNVPRANDLHEAWSMIRRAIRDWSPTNA